MSRAPEKLVIEGDDHEGRELAQRHVDEVLQALVTTTDTERAVYLYTVLGGYWELLAQQPTPFKVVAPLARVDGVDMNAVLSSVMAKIALEEAECKRELDMLQAKAEVDKARALFGDDSDQCRIAMAKALQYLPKALKESLHAKAIELGLMPPTSGYTADDEPVFTVEAIATHFGMNPEQVMQEAGEFVMTVDASTIHRTQ